jgi:hypothetical protein
MRYSGMARIAFLGILLVIAGNLPVILYGFWAWRVIQTKPEATRTSRRSLAEAQVTFRIILWAVVVSVILPFWSQGVSVLGAFIGYNLQGDEAALANVFFTFAFLPGSLSSWIDASMLALGGGIAVPEVQQVLVMALLVSLLVLSSVVLLLVTMIKKRNR